MKGVTVKRSGGLKISRENERKSIESTHSERLLEMAAFYTWLDFTLTLEMRVVIEHLRGKGLS